MAFKFVVFAAFVALARAGNIAPVAYTAAAPVAYAAPAHVAVDTEYDPNPQYSYAYDVQDALTGDSKSQHETRNGDVVQGSYSLLEADGTRRTVDYTADAVNGFNAVVRKEPAVAHVAAPIAAAPIAAAPIAAAPIAAAPIASAPVVVDARFAPRAYNSLGYAPVSRLAYAQPQLAYNARIAAPLQYRSAHLGYSAPINGYYH